jgi:apolipoprotein N-acyltransferase
VNKFLGFALALLSGVSLTFAYAPFDYWFITPIALTIVIRQLLRQPEHGFKIGWCFGLGWFGAGISWVHVSIADFGGLPLVFSLAIMLLLCGYLALFPALCFYLTQRFFKLTLWPIALPFLWFSCEWLRSWLFTGFPWLSIGYSQLDSPLSGWLPIIGETGVSLLVIMLATSFAFASMTKRLIPVTLMTAVIVMGGLTLNTVAWIQPNKTLSVGMAQGNIAQSLRWVPEQDAPTMASYANLTQLLWENDLIIWPEAAIPKLEWLAQDYLADMNNQAAAHDTAIVTGIVNYNFESGDAWNNLIVLGKANAEDTHGHYNYFSTNRYAKHHLLPIGEFVPFEDWLRPLAPLFDLPMSSFNRGDYQQPNLLANGIHLASAICFEIAFPHQVLANIHNDTDFIITVSNDAWFGHSHGPAQHLQIARMRAKEFGIPVIRSTNNGISAFIDYRGDIIAQLPTFEVAALSATVQTGTGKTPYRYLGDLPIYIISLVLFAIFLVTKTHLGRRHN